MKIMPCCYPLVVRALGVATISIVCSIVQEVYGIDTHPLLDASSKKNFVPGICAEMKHRCVAVRSSEVLQWGLLVFGISVCAIAGIPLRLCVKFLCGFA